MASGHGWFDVDTIWHWIEGVVGAIAITASSAVAWMFRRYRRHVGMLEDHAEYIARLKKLEAVGRIANHERKLREIDRIRKETEDGKKAIRMLADHEKQLAEQSRRIDQLDGNHDQLVQLLHSVQSDVKEVRRDMAWMKDVFKKP